MCLQTGEAHLGPADAVLDLAGRRLLFAPGLAPGERLLLARRLLAAAGMEQDGYGATCICGCGIDVTSPAVAPPEFTRVMRHGGAARVRITGPRDVVVSMEGGASYRAGDEGPAWQELRKLIAEDEAC